jgi:hypothetical protein
MEGEAGGIAFWGVCCGCGEATEPSLAVRPWYPMESERCSKVELWKRLGEESWGEGEAGREGVKEKRKARREGGVRSKDV